MFQFVGCFQDTLAEWGWGILQAILSLNDAGMTVELCADLAAASGWTYFGLENGGGEHLRA